MSWSPGTGELNDLKKNRAFTETEASLNIKLLEHNALNTGSNTWLTHILAGYPLINLDTQI